jgi:hypothetical protein
VTIKITFLVCWALGTNNSGAIVLIVCFVAWKFAKRPLIVAYYKSDSTKFDTPMFSKCSHFPACHAGAPFPLEELLAAELKKVQ